MQILWIAVAVVLVIALIKTSLKLLKFVCIVGLVAVALFFLSSIGVLPF